MDVVFSLFLTITLTVGIIWFVCKIDVESKEDSKKTREDLVYKKINTFFPNLNKDVFQKTLYDIKHNNEKYYWTNDTIFLYQLDVFYLNYKFYKNIFDIFNSKYYFYNNNEIYLGIIEDFNDICKLDDRVGELPKSSSLSYKNFLINSFLKKYGQKLVRNGNESYYVNTYTLRQEYCLSIEDKEKYINKKENL